MATITKTAMELASCSACSQVHATHGHSHDYAADLSARLTVIVPCYNEQATVERLLQRVRAALPQAQIIVVDDGSTDETPRLIASQQANLKLYINTLAVNEGKGAAFRAGLVSATRQFTIIQDADLEYDPSDIPGLLKTAIDRHCDAVFGSRYMGNCRPEGVSMANYVAVRILSLILRYRQGSNLTDPATCYKLVRTDVLRAMNLNSSGFELCQEINVKLHGSFRKAVTEVPISYHPRTHAAGKKIRWYDFIPSFFRAVCSAR